jgi:uncharacterized surface protein with fasciclin (FAS1) repeats
MSSEKNTLKNVARAALILALIVALSAGFVPGALAADGPVTGAYWPQPGDGAAPCAALHTVGAGESLTGIAMKYGVSLNALIDANDLANPNIIVIGQTLCIPGALAAKDIVDTAAASGFNTFVAALKAAGLVETLRSPGPFTVFAPTDAAFAALPPGTLDTLLADPTGALRSILLYHVVAGELYAASLSDGLTVYTVQGEPLSFSVSGDLARVNDAYIVTKDIQASNGVIHAIDAVLIPPSLLPDPPGTGLPTPKPVPVPMPQPAPMPMPQPDPGYSTCAMEPAYDAVHGSARWAQ